MLFKFKEKPLIVECFTKTPFAFENCKPFYTKNFIPDWWKQLPSNSTNLKACRGFTKYNNLGFILPFWTEIEFIVGNQKEKTFGVKHLPDQNFSQHIPEEQYPGLYDTNHNYRQIKIHSPWRFKTSEDVPFVLTDPFWHKSKPFDWQVMPGVIEFKYTHDSHINFLFNFKEESNTLFFKPREPIAQFIPVTERKIVLKHELLDDYNYNRYEYYSMFPSIKKFYIVRDIIRNREQIEKDTEKTCPFTGKK